MTVLNYIENPKAVYKRLLTYVKPYWGIFMLAMIGNIFYGLVDAAFVKLLQPLLDRGFVARDQDFIRIVPYLLIGMFLIRGIASFMSSYCMGWVGRQVILVFRQKMFQKFLKLPARFYDHATSGELLSRITYNVEQVAAASSEALTVIVREGFAAIGLIIVMLTVNWRLTCLFFFMIPLMAVLFLHASKRLRGTSSQVQGSMGNVAHTVEEIIEGYKEVKAFGGQAYEIARFNTATQANRRQEMRLIRIDGILMPLIQVVAAFGLAGTIYLATLPTDHFLNTAITPGGFATIVSSMVALLRPIKQLTKINGTIQRGIAGAASIFELLDLEEEIDTGSRTVARAKGHIVFDQVCFQYGSSSQPVLSQVSFEVKPGEIVAIVGRSGSGKSTLVNLLPRFYEIESGQITLDGIPLDQFKLDNLREQFSLVTQHVTLFNDTVANNIAYGKSGVSIETIRSAAKSAYALDFIEQLPQGFETIIGENGVRLSGGQRQRLAIARAILKQAPILILDEATSALDTESERYIQQALDTLMKKCTTLVIAHRLSTIENAHKIVVLDQGVVRETGSHLTLIANQDLYASLRYLQYEKKDNDQTHVGD